MSDHKQNATKVAAPKEIRTAFGSLKPTSVQLPMPDVKPPKPSTSQSPKR